MRDKPMNRFSIQHRGLPKGRAYEAWRDGICRGFCRLDVGPGDSEFIDCHNEFTLLDVVSIATPRGQAARFARTRDLLTDGCDDLVLISATHGKMRVTQQNRDIDLSAGQMCLTEMNVIGSADLTSNGGFTTMRFPRSLLLQVAPSAETRLARAIEHDRALTSMIDRYSNLCNDVAADLDTWGQMAAARHLTELVGLLLGTAADGASVLEKRGELAARIDLIKKDIRNNLSSGNLNVEVIAKRNALSTRQAQRLFASFGSTFSEFVLEERLLLAQRLLLDAEHRTRKVSDVAYSAGFNDLSYFHRCFRRRFGMTPSDMQMSGR
jgi:AraC-like DNA-binding protein